MGNEEKTVSLGKEGIYDARQLGVPKMLILGIQDVYKRQDRFLPQSFLRTEQLCS